MKKFASLLILLALIVILWQLTRLNYEDLSWATNENPYNGIINMFILITGMFILIKTYKKRASEDEA